MIDETNEKPLEQIYEIDIDDIELSDENVRLSHASKDLDELAASIKRHGLLQPVVLIGELGTPPYKLISGQRRFLAHKQILKRRKIRAVFVAKKLTKTEAIIRSLVENLQRVELEYADTAEAVTFLYKKLGDEKEVQKATGLSLRRIRDFILIEARATPKMKKLMKDEKVSPADVKRAIRAAQDDLNKAQELLELIADNNKQLTNDQRKRIVSYGETHKSASASSIFEEARKPQVQQNIIVTLPEKVRGALVKATESLQMEAEELAAKILSDWLNAQGFI
jgi:ParB family transcriptional regulator, chromosome partitioning protein